MIQAQYYVFNRNGALLFLGGHWKDSQVQLEGQSGDSSDRFLVIGTSDFIQKIKETVSPNRQKALALLQIPNQKPDYSYIKNSQQKLQKFLKDRNCRIFWEEAKEKEALEILGKLAILSDNEPDPETIQNWLSNREAFQNSDLDLLRYKKEVILSTAPYLSVADSDWNSISLPGEAIHSADEPKLRSELDSIPENQSASDRNSTSPTEEKPQEELPLEESEPEIQPVLPEEIATEKVDNLTTEKVEETLPVTQTKTKTEKKQPAKTETKEAESPSEGHDRAKSAKWSIQVKMMLVLSAIFAGTVSVIIFLATYFFRSDSELRILENNLQFVDVVGQKVRSDTDSILAKAKQLAETLNRERSGSAQRQFFVDLFFQNDPDFLFLGIYRNNGNTLVANDTIFNEIFLSETKFTKESLLSVIDRKQSEFLQSFSGKPQFLNVSSGLKEPAFAISIPSQSNGSASNILVVIVRLDKLKGAFQQTGITQTFLVNGSGTVIAHPDEKQIIGESSLLDLEIVKSLLKSPNNNGQQKFTDPSGRKFIGSFKKLGFAGAGIVSIVPEDKAFEEVYNIQQRNIYIMMIALCSALIIVFFFAKTISGPILRLLTATDDISRGNFQISIKPTTSDEVGLLTEHFIAMGKGLEEREKVKDALGRFVNKEVAEMVLKKELTLGGEQKECAIFFSDIRSFTAISEKLTPEEVVGFLNEYMTEMVTCINDTGGVVDKFIGDAIMATWGAVGKTDNDAESAVNAALQMRIALMKFNEGRGGDKNPIIRIGCGMNYGPVIAGQIGSEQRLEYTVIGDAVNLASRVEALNKPFGTDILITQDLYNTVKDTFRVEKMQAIKVKGKDQPQTIYAVLGRLDDPDCPQTMQEVRDLVGIQWEPPKAGAKSAELGEEVKYEILE